MPKPCCYDCLSEDVAVKLIDEFGFEHWFCAEDRASGQAFGEALRKFLEGAAGKLQAPLESPGSSGG